MNLLASHRYAGTPSGSGHQTTLDDHRDHDYDDHRAIEALGIVDACREQVAAE